MHLSRRQPACFRVCLPQFRSNPSPAQISIYQLAVFKNLGSFKIYSKSTCRIYIILKLARCLLSHTYTHLYCISYFRSKGVRKMSCKPSTWNSSTLGPPPFVLPLHEAQAVGVPAAGGALLVHRAAHGLCSARAAPLAATAPSTLRT